MCTQQGRAFVLPQSAQLEMKKSEDQKTLEEAQKTVTSGVG